MGQRLASKSALNRLSAALNGLTPEALKAARYAPKNPRDIVVLAVREFACAATVEPSTIVHMAQLCPDMGNSALDTLEKAFAGVKVAGMTAAST